MLWFLVPARLWSSEAQRRKVFDSRKRLEGYGVLGRQGQKLSWVFQYSHFLLQVLRGHSVGICLLILDSGSSGPRSLGCWCSFTRVLHAYKKGWACFKLYLECHNKEQEKDSWYWALYLIVYCVYDSIVYQREPQWIFE